MVFFSEVETINKRVYLQTTQSNVLSTKFFSFCHVNRCVLLYSYLVSSEVNAAWTRSHRLTKTMYVLYLSCTNVGTLRRPRQYFPIQNVKTYTLCAHNTQRWLDVVCTTSMMLGRRHMNVKTTLCAYWFSSL